MSSAPSPLSASSAAYVFKNHPSNVLTELAQKIGSPEQLQEFLGKRLADASFILRLLQSSGPEGAKLLRGIVNTPGIADLLIGQGFETLVTGVKADIAAREQGAVSYGASIHDNRDLKFEKEWHAMMFAEPEPFTT